MITAGSFVRRALLLALGIGVFAGGCDRSGDTAAARSGVEAAGDGRPLGTPVSEVTGPRGASEVSVPRGASVVTSPRDGASEGPTSAKSGTGQAGSGDSGLRADRAAPREPAAPADRSAASRQIAAASPDPFPRPEDVPLAKMGLDIGESPVKNSPGYSPGNDPEADAVKTGRREVQLIDQPFTGGMRSPEELALYILDAIRKQDRNALEGIRVTFPEFAEILWPEFPQSRPYCNSNAKDAFFYLDNTSHQGIGLILSRLGGHELDLEGISYTGGRAPYTNFTLFHDVQLRVRTASGESLVLRCARTFAERKGRWKVYAYKDWE